MNKLLLKQVAALLKQKKQTLAVAESCTGGLVSCLLTNIPGSSVYFKGSLVVYSNYSKYNWLNISAKLINKYGAVSSVVANAMAKNVRTKARASIGLGITGIAGPGGGTKKKPVGLVYIALSARSLNLVREFKFTPLDTKSSKTFSLLQDKYLTGFIGRRLKIKEKSALSALKILKDYLEKL